MTTFDYAQFNKKGLKDVVKWLNKQTLPVSEVRGNNLPKRENGFQVKTAEIEFESGQVLVLKAKPDVPAFFQVKLNGKVMAIRDYKQLDNELREIAAYVKENEPKFAKNQEKSAARAKIKVDLPKAVNTTVAEQTDALKAGLSELQGQSEALANQLTEITAQVNLKVNTLTDLQSKLDAEKATTAELEAVIEKAKGSTAVAAPVAHVVTLREAPSKMAMLETKMRYDVLLNGAFHSELYFNTKGYVGSLPMPNGKNLSIGETSIAQYKKEISRINKDAKAGIMESAWDEYKPLEYEPVFESAGATCPECNAAMDSCEVEKDADSQEMIIGYRCPKCGCEVDAEGVVLEGCKEKIHEAATKAYSVHTTTGQIKGNFDTEKEAQAYVKADAHPELLSILFGPKGESIKKEVE